jgi:inosose dehydratase
VRAEKLSYVQAVQAGVFCPLEAGEVNIPQVVRAFRGIGYNNWLVVEQDIDLSVPGYAAPFEGAARARVYLKETVSV